MRFGSVTAQASLWCLAALLATGCGGEFFRHTQLHTGTATLYLVAEGDPSVVSRVERIRLGQRVDRHGDAAW